MSSCRRYSAAAQRNAHVSRLIPPAKLTASAIRPWSIQDTYRYHNYFWARHMTTAEFPQYHCDFWVPLMSGWGGNSVLLLPNGATFYIFSDGGEFDWFGAVNEINKIAPICN